MKPVLFVTNHAPAFRIGAFKALSERIDVSFALIGGDVRHGGGGTQATPFNVTHPSQRHVARMAASGRYRAVVAGSPAASRSPPPTREPERAARRSSCGRRSGATREPPRTR